MIELAIIASQDVETRTWLDNSREIQLPAGDTTVAATMGSLHGRELIVLPRNGSGCPVPPHALDYRANIEALARAGVRRVLTTAMVGSLRRSIPTGSMLILDQFIDFTRDRQSTYFTGSQFGHADMTEPYLSDHEMKSEDWRDSRRMHAARFTQIVAHMAQLPTLDGPDGWASCRCTEAAPIEK